MIKAASHLGTWTLSRTGLSWAGEDCAPPLRGCGCGRDKSRTGQAAHFDLQQDVVQRRVGDARSGLQPRTELAEKFTGEFPITLLLKGSRTIVAEKGKFISYNTTGNPGMATAGTGDVLTGVCAAFLARGISPYDAARLGAWLCGRAAELAANRFSEESMLPSDLFAHFGPAFRELRAA